MKKNLKVSVIIPVYNVQQYLKECIESIVNQTYSNIEIIIINDGSTDGSHNICQKYQKQDSRIIYVNKNNEGVSATRNKGIHISTGELIMFVDSDDYLDIDVIEKLIKHYKQGELLCFGYKMLYLNKAETKEFGKSTQYITKDEIVLNEAIKGYLWNKIFESKVIKKNQIFFDETISFCEDLYFITEYVKYCNKVKYISDIYYNYRIRKSSVTGNFCNRKNTSSLKAYEKIIDEFRDNKKVLEVLTFEYLFNYYRLKKIIKKSLGINIRYDLIKKQHEVLVNKRTKEKIKFFMVKYIPSLYEKIRKIKKKNMYD